MFHKVVKSQENRLVGAGAITLTVLEARDLAAMDANGKSDPFAKITANFCKQVFQTHTQKKTLTPVWNESFPLYVGQLEPSHEITVKLFDRDLIGEDYLGEVVVNVSELINAADDSIERWFPLVDEPTKNYNKGDKKPGQILLKLHYPKKASLRGTIKQEDPTKLYKFEGKLGRGAFAKVRKAVHKDTGKVCAVKILRKKKMNKDQKTLLEREIAVMAKLKHPNIVELIEAYDTPKYTYLVLELVSGGELFDEIINRAEPYYEEDTKIMLRQLMLAAEYMHGMGIAHRDLKPENLLFSPDHKTLKITDFGLSKDFTSEKLTTSCGTAIYVAPEVLMASSYGTGCDIWSLGVITYILLSAHVPFDGTTENEVFEKVLRAAYSFPKKLFEHISDEAKDFIAKIFVVDTKLRMDATQCLEHPWLAGGAPDEDDSSSSLVGTPTPVRRELTGFRNNIKVFAESQRNLRKDEAPEMDSDSDDQ